MTIDAQAPRRRGFFGTLWWLIDGSRKLVLNLLFLAVIGLLVAAWLTGGTPKLKDKTVLVLNLTGPLVEQHSGSARDQALAQVRGEAQRQVQLRDLIAVLEAAAKDDKITGLLLVLDDFGGAGLANMREATQAVERFKKASGGKKVTAWAMHYSQRQYHLAAAADEVYLHPMGTVMIEGYGRLRNYYREAFDRLGVAANVIRVGKYKNFGEPYFANGPSKETLEADAMLYDAMWADYTLSIEKARKLPAGAIMQGIEALPAKLAAAGGSPAKMAMAEKLVDGLKTRDELRAMLIERHARDDEAKTFRQVSFNEYLGRLKPRQDGDAVGIVVAEGDIVDGEAGPGKVGGRSTAELARKARDDTKIKAVVLRVNSPGGSAFASELVRRELELTRAAGKPVVVSMGDVAASGGYWISMAADEVIADASTITGSIGVFAMLPTADGLVGKLSLHTGGYATTWLANAYDPRKPLDPRFAGLVQSAIGNIYTDFTGKAAVARKSSPEKIDAVAQGRVWTGKQAQERGLVDRLGSYGDAIAAAATRAKLAADPRVVYLERDRGKLHRLLGLLGVRADQGWLAQWAREAVDVDAMSRQAAGPVAGLAGAALPEATRELAWLTDLLERRQPFAAVVHCLCQAP